MRLNINLKIWIFQIILISLLSETEYFIRPKKNYAVENFSRKEVFIAVLLFNKVFSKNTQNAQF